MEWMIRIDTYEIGQLSHLVSLPPPYIGHATPIIFGLRSLAAVELYNTLYLEVSKSERAELRDIVGLCTFQNGLKELQAQHLSLVRKSNSFYLGFHVSLKKRKKCAASFRTTSSLLNQSL